MRRTKRLGGSGGVWRSSYIVLGLPSWWFGRLGITRDARRLPRLGWPWFRRLGEFDRSRFFSQRRQSHRHSFVVQRFSSAIRALTSFLTSPTGIGFASGSRTVPFDILYPFSSVAGLRRIAPVIGYRLQWCLNTAYQTSGRPSSRKAGMP